MNEEVDLELVDRRHPSRAEAEDFAKKCYRLAYGAEIKTFASELIVLRSGDSGVMSCVGINMPGKENFFIGQYLDAPLEESISKVLGKDIDISDVAEIGTLATGTKGLCRLTMIGLAGFLKSRGIKYIAFSGNKSVRNTLEGVGIPLHFIAEALPERLEGGAGEWGSYYESEPEVVFLDINIACIQLEKSARELNNLPENVAAMMIKILEKSLVLENKIL